MNILTVDVEDWYQTNGVNFPIETWGRYEDRVRGSTMRILDMLEEQQVPATFFVLGCVAQKHPGLVKEIQRRGHEIGSHGGWHRMVSRMTLDEFAKDLRESKAVLEDLTGTPIRYYRAPTWSISPERYGALSILEQEGIICDSSLQPFRTPLSGNADVPVYPFHPVLEGRRLKLLEFPPTVFGWNRLKVPFAGGFYLRFWPSWFSVHLLQRINRNRTGMVYVHPWEFDTGFPRIKLPPWLHLAQYYKLDTTEAKVRRLIDKFRFVPLGKYLEEGLFPDFELASKPSKRRSG
ncbi:polysaccharide deacetylase family protein [Ferviditalea candida]|uniref:Polysaccharide deacetylase family protein n=1 Tax=Ferviditalea candida TaxID=3108399 RepID=A0ABU5ZJ56_9BACL|nr:polysaccharide deacetylase family protein [Paenibacillaceae bacterium T2]